MKKAVWMILAILLSIDFSQLPLFSANFGYPPMWFAQANQIFILIIAAAILVRYVGKKVK